MAATARRGSTKATMVRSAAVSMRRRGVEETSFAQVLIDSEAPRGSLYHHFPRGRVQMLEEATDFAAGYVAAQLRSCFATGSPGAGIQAFADIYLELLRTSDYEEGCPLLVAGLEGSRRPTVRDAAAHAFSSWTQIIADALVREGIDPARATPLATTILSVLEGAIAISRAQRSQAPLRQSAHELATFIDSIEA